MNAVNQIPEHQKPAFMASLEAMQTKDSLWRSVHISNCRDHLIHWFNYT